MNFLKIYPVIMMILSTTLPIVAAEKTSGTRPAAQSSSPVQSASICNPAADSDLLALPNPARDHYDNIILVYQTRCIGTAKVTIYDAVGSVVYETATKIEVPNAVGHKIAIPWDCRNKSGRIVGNGTYLAVIQMFDPANRPVTRHTANIGVAF